MSSDLPWTISPASVPPPHKKRKKKKNPAAKRRTPPRGPNPLDQHRPETVTLRCAHNLNGAEYGPGTVTVPHIVAQALLNQEHLVLQDEERFRRDDRGVIIGGRTAQGSIRTYEVPGSTFDSAYGAAIPEVRVSGKGYSDPGTAAGNPTF